MPTDWTKRQSQAIDLLRFPMAVAVVMLHYGTTLINDATGALRALCILFEEGICRLAVPCFFLISGFLFFQGLQEWDWSRWQEKLKRRVGTLLIPYILWIVVDFFVYWCYALIQGETVTLAEQFRQAGGIRIFWSTNGGLPISVKGVPLDGPLWFIRDLMYFTIAAPLIYLFLSKTRQVGIIIVCAIFICIQGIIPEGLVFFMTGAFLQIKRKNICEILWPGRTWLYILSLFFLVTACLFFNIPFWGRFAKNIFLFIGIGAIFCWAASLNGKVKANPFLIRSSFFIFATHEILILRQIAIPFVWRMVSWTGSVWDCLRFFLIPSFTVCICLALLFLMERISPKATNVLIGRVRK